MDQARELKHTHVSTVYDQTERTAHTCFCCELCLFHSIHSPAFLLILESTCQDQMWSQHSKQHVQLVQE